MKTVYSDISTIAHLWANQTQENAKNPSRNFYFNGDTIYSYGSHFPIAKHIQHDGIKAVLFTERKYSVTTSKHISVVHQACRHLNVISCFNPECSHEQNFANWLYEAKSILAKLTNAKKPEIYLSQLSDVSYRVTRYAEYFEIEIPLILSAALAITNKSEYSEYTAKAIEFERQEKARKEKELAARHKKELSKWINGEGHRLYVHDGYDYLRLNEGRIETTQAVRIPLEMAKQLWLNLDSLKIGDSILNYTVNSIGKEIKIGCHTFKKTYLQKFGEKVFSNS